MQATEELENESLELESTPTFLEKIDSCEDAEEWFDSLEADEKIDAVFFELNNKTALRYYDYKQLSFEWRGKIIFIFNNLKLHNR